MFFLCTWMCVVRFWACFWWACAESLPRRFAHRSNIPIEYDIQWRQLNGILIWNEKMPMYIVDPILAWWLAIGWDLPCSMSMRTAPLVTKAAADPALGGIADFRSGTNTSLPTGRRGDGSIGQGSNDDLRRTQHQWRMCLKGMCYSSVLYFSSIGSGCQIWNIFRGMQHAALHATS